MTDEFYEGTDWQGSSEPWVPRDVQDDDLWPHADNVAGKDALASGLHPVLAIGHVGDVDRDMDVCGVVVTFNEVLDRAVLNVAPGYICKQYVANILTYAESAPATWAASLYIGQSVYVDSSTVAQGLAAGVTLTLSPFSADGSPNPRAGVLFYDQTEQQDVGIGGGNVDAWPKTVLNDRTVYTLVNVKLWPTALGWAVVFGRLPQQ